MRKIVALALAAAALGSSLLSSTTGDDRDEACFRMKTNAYRSRGNALARDDRIDRIARDHSDEMAADETAYHSSNLGSELPPYEYGGENVGMGPDCDTLFRAFQSSPAHRANLLDPDYERLGVGVTRRDDTLYVTLIFFTPAEQPEPDPEECR